MPVDAFEPHPIVRTLGEPAADFTAGDLVRAAEQLDLRQVDLRYVGGDGRLKTLAFAIHSRAHLTEVLVRGERVDGSSVFAGTDANASDVYVVPRHRTAFVDPFVERLVRDGASTMVGEDGINDTGRRLVAGYLSMARALTAFGTTVPTSYLRFTDGDESPEGICWGEKDRTGLVRVPLAWGGDVLPGMVAHANDEVTPPGPSRRTARPARSSCGPAGRSR
jgi:glutamine synthetase